MRKKNKVNYCTFVRNMQKILNNYLSFCFYIEILADRIKKWINEFIIIDYFSILID